MLRKILSLILVLVLVTPAWGQVTVPTLEQFDALQAELDDVKARVKALEDTPVDPPDDPDPPLPPPLDPPDDPDPPPVDPGEMALWHGPIPTDGFLSSNYKLDYLWPKRKIGIRLTGTVTLEPNKNPGVPIRLLVDGVPQETWTIDTTQWADGTHVLGVQMLADAQFSNGSKVYVFNNSGEPLQATANQAVTHAHSRFNNDGVSLAWGRVNVLPNQPAPLGHGDTKHPLPTTPEDRQRLTEQVWWVEGYNHQGGAYRDPIPILVKNSEGDYFVKHWDPKLHSTSEHSWEHVGLAPAFDGQRGINHVHGYSTIIADRKVLVSGYTGWLAVDLSGRVMELDITGNVTTIFGPRSVAGVVQTDPTLFDVSLSERLAMGEKELVGDSSGRLQNSQDLWLDPEDDDVIWIADTNHNRIAKLSRSQQTIVRSDTVPDVISCWINQNWRDEGVEWFAVNPEGLWCKRINGEPTFMAQLDAPASAQWIRGDGETIYVQTLGVGLFRWNGDDTFTELIPGSSGTKFAFMTIDTAGTVGPKGWIYLGHFQKTKTHMRVYIPETGEIHNGLTSGHVLNHPRNNREWDEDGTELASGTLQTQEPMGHYIWAFAPHATMPKLLTAGAANTSLFVWTGHLGPEPVPDPPIAIDGLWQMQIGEPDKYLGMSAIFGRLGHGRLGYSCDRWRRLKTWEEAEPVMRAELEGMWPEVMPEDDRTAVMRHLFMQRTRPHFQ